ncbi:MAG: 50S ribosomal protein L6 [Anaerolineales bacterium]|nr:50S ribosomal protein L6 [Anaerolineales bacterium]
MSRIGRLPVDIPAGVEVKIDGTSIYVKGKRGELSHTFPPVISLEQEGSQVIVKRKSDEKFDKSMHGTARSLVFNMVNGVSEGFTKELQIEGVGYRAEMQGENLALFVGYSHEVIIEPPQGMSFEVENRGRDLKITGYDKEAVGELAANIRKIRPPEPYKGKGIRYNGERVRRKAGKTGKA